MSIHTSIDSGQDHHKIDSNRKGFDALWVKLLLSLSGSVVDNISQSAHQMLDIACQFFEKDVSDSLQDFQDLYLAHSELNDYKDAINRSVDDLLTLASAPDFKPADLADESEAFTSLASLQKDLEAFVTQDQKVKDRLVPVMQSMQYEDIVVNQIQRLVKCWEYLIVVVNFSGETQYDYTIKKLYDLLSSEDEHRCFVACFLEKDQKEFMDVSEERCIHALIADHNVNSPDQLVQRFLKFSDSFLALCIEQTQHSFSELMHLLQLINKESDETRYLFSKESVTNDAVMNIIEHFDEADSQAVVQKLKSLLEVKEGHENAAGQLAMSLMMTMQSQDKIRQQIENITKNAKLWWEFRDELPDDGLSMDATLLSYQKSVLDILCVDAEREVVSAIFPAIDEDGDDDEEVELF